MGHRDAYERGRGASSSSESVCSFEGIAEGSLSLAIESNLDPLDPVIIADGCIKVIASFPFGLISTSRDWNG